MMGLMVVMMALFSSAFGQPLARQSKAKTPFLVSLRTKHLLPTDDKHLLPQHTTLRASEPGVITMEHNKPTGQTVIISTSIPDSQIEGLEFDHNEWDEYQINETRYYKFTSNKVTFKGSEAYPLTMLSVENCALTKIDLTKCPELAELYINNNPELKELDFSKNTEIKTIGAGFTGLTSVNIANLKNLSVASFAPSALVDVDVAGCDELKFLLLFGNKIKGEKMTKLMNDLPDRNKDRMDEGWLFITGDNPRYTEGNVCLVSDVKVARKKHWRIKDEDRKDYKGADYVPSYTEDKITFTTEIPVREEIHMRIEGVEDADFKVEGAEFWQYHYRRDEYILTSQTVTITGKVGYLDLSECRISSLDISGNKELEVFLCTDNFKIKSLDLSQHVKLKRVDISRCPIRELNLQNAKDLESFVALSTRLNKIDIAPSDKLTELQCSNTTLSGVEPSKWKNLENLTLAGCDLTQLDLSENKKLEMVQLHANELDKLVFASPMLYSATVFLNKIKGVDMTHMMQSLPRRYEGAQPQAAIVVYGMGQEDEKNECLDTDVKIALDAFWKVYQVDADFNESPYRGVPTANAPTISGEAAIAVYPNPASDLIFISGVSDQEPVQLYGLDGQILLQVIPIEGLARLDVRAIPSGAYVVRCGKEAYPVQISHR